MHEATSVQNKPPAKGIFAAHLEQTVGLQLKAEVWMQQSAECAHAAVCVTPGHVQTLAVTSCSPRLVGLFTLMELQLVCCNMDANMLRVQPEKFVSQVYLSAMVVCN